MHRPVDSSEAVTRTRERAARSLHITLGRALFSLLLAHAACADRESSADPQLEVETERSPSVPPSTAPPQPPAPAENPGSSAPTPTAPAENPGSVARDRVEGPSAPSR